MDKNSSDPVKVDLSLQGSATAVNGNQTANFSIGSDESYTTNKTRNGRASNAVSVLAIVLGSLALILAVVVAAINQTAINSTNSEIKSLMNQMTQLAMNISEIKTELLLLTREESTQLEAQIGNLANSYVGVSNGLQEGQRSLTELQTQLNAMRSELELRINNEITVLNEQQNITSNELTSVFVEVGDIRGDMNGLTQRINSSTGIYDSCKKDQVTSFIGGPLSGRFWRTSGTPYLPIDVEDYYTVGIRCHYKSVYRGHQVATSIYQDPNTGDVRCRCSFTLPDAYNTHPLELPSSLSATCFLTITRCPLQQKLFVETL